MQNNLNVMNINHSLCWENFKFLRKWCLKNENLFTDCELNAIGITTFHQKQLEYTYNN